MVRIHHLNCVDIQSPIGMRGIGHCLLLETDERLILVDTGIGLLDNQHPGERIGQQTIDMIGYRFDEQLTAVRQIEHLGLDPEKVTDCIVSHLDHDHISGLSDFPKAKVHVGIEEFDNFHSGNPRYNQTPLSHNPVIKTYAETDWDWFGFEARKISLNIEAEIFFIPLFGHTTGHCGVAIQIENNRLFYVGDAYYLKVELEDANHPVNDLVNKMADNNELRMETLEKIRKFANENPGIEIFSYHDPKEFESFITET